MSIPYKHDLTDLAETPVAFSGIDILDAGADAIELPNEVAFFRDTFSLNTQADGLGFAVTGFLFIEEVASLSDYWGRLVYRKIQITDPAYQAGHVYAFGDVAGSVIGAADVNRLDDEDVALQGQIDMHDAELGAHDGRIVSLEDERFPNLIANPLVRDSLTGITESGATSVAWDDTDTTLRANGALKADFPASGTDRYLDIDLDALNGLDVLDALTVRFGYKQETAADDLVTPCLYDGSVEVPLGCGVLSQLGSIGQLIKTVGIPTSTLVGQKLRFKVKDATAAVFWLASVEVTTERYVSGGAIGEWQAYTPTFGAGFGAATNVNCRWRRVGPNMELVGTLTVGTVSANPATFSLPSGYTARTDVDGIFGLATIAKAATAGSTNLASVIVLASAKSSLSFASGGDGSTSHTLVPNNCSSLFGSGTTIAFQASIPIDQWTGNVNLASDFTEYAFNTQASPNTHDTTSYGHGPGGAPILANTSVTYHDVKFIRPIQPTDAITLEVRRVSDGTWVHLDQTAISSLHITTIGPEGYVNNSGNRYNSGVLVSGSAAGNGVRVLWMASAAFSGSSWSGAAVQGRSWASVIAAADGYDRWRVRKVSNGNMAEVPPLVFADYYGAATVGANTKINYATRVEDTHNAVAVGAGTWVFTAPIAGLYRFEASAKKDSSAGLLYLWKGGSSFRLMGYLAASQVGKGVATVRLAAGETVDVRCSGSTLTDATTNTAIQIARIGG